MYRGLLVRAAIQLGLINGDDRQSATRFANWVSRYPTLRETKDGKSRTIGFVDIGANSGVWLGHFLTLASEGGVCFNPIVAVEPNALLAGEIESNVHGWGVEIQDFVLTSEDKRVEFVIDADNSRLSRVEEGGSGEFRDGIPLSRLLSRYAEETEWVLKLDVEGHELEVILGLGEKIQHCLAIYFEVGDGSNVAPYQQFGIYEFLRSKGFNLYTLGYDGAPMLSVHPGSLASLASWTHDVLAVNSKLGSDQANWMLG